MRTLITGARGFVGRALVGALAAREDGSIVATDVMAGYSPVLPSVAWRTDRLDDPDALAELMAVPYDRIIHLATVAGVGSAQFDIGRATNLIATQNLLEAARRSGKPPRFIYASSVGVFGSPLPAMIDDETLPVPTTSYGTHKLIGELLVSDYARAGLVDGLALRLPGIVARPRGSTTMLSAFLSDLFHAACNGEPFTIPLAPDDATWTMSLSCLIDNLLTALDLPANALPPRRYWTLPALFVRMDALVTALTNVYGTQRTDRIAYAPDPAVQAMFAQVPLSAPGAERLGLKGDGNADRLVRNVIASDTSLMPGSKA